VGTGWRSIGPNRFPRELSLSQPLAKYLIKVSNILLLLTFLHGCAPAQSGGAPPLAFPPASVKLFEVKLTQVEQSSEYEAMLKSRQSISLYPQVDGHITKIFASSGNDVKSGTPLMEIDPLRQKASVDSYREARQSAQADLENASDTLKSLEASKVSRISNLHYTKQQHARYQTLSEQGAVAKSDFDQWTNQAEAAQADLDNVEAQIRAQEATIRKLARAIRQADANLKTQQVQLGYYTVIAPFAGTVGDIPVKLGDYVTPTSKLTTVTQNKPLEAYLNVPTERVGEIHKDTPIILLSLKEEKIGFGKVFFIAPNVDETNQSVLVKASIPNEGGRLRADQIVRAKIIFKTLPGFLIPTQAVSHSGGQEFVFIAQSDGKEKVIARQVPVKLGDVQGDAYQVLNGLKSGDKLVVSGIQNLTDGSAIAVNP
jgi:multidrug efflux pump subunit AcrA (membrane-fusion protein)